MGSLPVVLECPDNGHSYIGHNYIGSLPVVLECPDNGHSCIGHNYIGSSAVVLNAQTTAISRTQSRLCYSSWHSGFS